MEVPNDDTDFFSFSFRWSDSHSKNLPPFPWHSSAVQSLCARVSCGIGSVGGNFVVVDMWLMFSPSHISPSFCACAEIPTPVPFISFRIGNSISSTRIAPIFCFSRSVFPPVPFSPRKLIENWLKPCYSTVSCVSVFLPDLPRQSHVFLSSEQKGREAKSSLESIH